MFDFRYHALTLVAVFVALAIGLLLGVAIGDQGLVSGAEQDLRQSLRGDVVEARAQVRSLQDQLGVARQYEEQTFGAVVANRLDTRRFALVFAGARDDRVFRGVRDAVQAAGGQLSFVTTLRAPIDLDAVGGLATGTRYEVIAEDPTLVDDLGGRIGEQLVTGGRLIRDLRPELFSSTNGELGPVEGVIVARHPSADLDEGTNGQVANDFVDGLVGGLRTARVPVVGVEAAATEPSQIRWYIDNQLASVDDVDRTPGMASLVVALAGEAEGHYGEKPTADSLLPDALTARFGSASG